MISIIVHQLSLVQNPLNPRRSYFEDTGIRSVFSFTARIYYISIGIYLVLIIIYIYLYSNLLYWIALRVVGVLSLCCCIRFCLCCCCVIYRRIQHTVASSFLCPHTVSSCRSDSNTAVIVILFIKS